MKMPVEKSRYISMVIRAAIDEMKSVNVTVMNFIDKKTTIG